MYILYVHQYSGGTKDFPMQGLTFLTGGLNLRGHDHTPFIILLFESQKHHVIFHKNNRNN